MLIAISSDRSEGKRFGHSAAAEAFEDTFQKLLIPPQSFKSDSNYFVLGHFQRKSISLSFSMVLDISIGRRGRTCLISTGRRAAEAMDSEATRIAGHPAEAATAIHKAGAIALK